MRRYKMDEKEFSEINITPFTDVVLVLLLIFMIASPLLVTGALKIKLPEASTAENINEKNIEIFMDSANKVYMDNKEMNMTELIIQVQGRVQSKPGTSVVIKADKEVYHGNFIYLLDELKKAGITKFLIATSKKK
jgi:biopolymer transport protein ExbD